MSKIFLLKDEIKLDKQDRLRLLSDFNNLRTCLHNIEECHDLWLSDISNLQKLFCSLHQLLKFSSGGEYWKDWELDTTKEGEVDEKSKSKS